MSSIFTKIVNQEIPSYKIDENELFYAFLDIFPLVKGHTLVIPKKEIDYLFDVDDDVLSKMMVFTKRIARAIDKTIECKRVGIVVLGLEVPHAHIHLIPLQKESDIHFDKPKLKFSDEEFLQIAQRIRNNL